MVAISEDLERRSQVLSNYSRNSEAGTHGRKEKTPELRVPVTLEVQQRCQFTMPLELGHRMSIEGPVLQSSFRYP